MSIHDENGEALHTIRYARMPAGDVAGLMTALEADTKALLAKRPDLHLAYLCDGGRDLWNLLEDWIDEEALGVKPVKLLDFWHVAEKLAAALRVIGKESGLARWKFLLLNRVDAVDTILEELQASGKRNTRVGKSRPVHEAITYLENNRELMNYTTARRRRLPIGSGIALEDQDRRPRAPSPRPRAQRSLGRWRSTHARALAEAGAKARGVITMKTTSCSRLPRTRAEGVLHSSKQPFTSGQTVRQWYGRSPLTNRCSSAWIRFGGGP